MMNLNGKSSKKWKIIIAVIVLLIVAAMIVGPIISGILAQGV